MSEFEVNLRKKEPFGGGEALAEKSGRNVNLTVPNLLSVIRILVTPLYAYFFLKGETVAAVIILALSGMTDFVDGFVARHFNQVTEIGKILDPFADKITQGVIALCMAIRFPAICPFLILFIVKELGMLCCSVFLLFKKKKKPGAAKWFGKVSTVLFYISVMSIIIMILCSTPEHIFNTVSNVLLCITAVMMVYSAVNYFIIFRGILNSSAEDNDIDLKSEIKARKEDK